MTRRRVVVTGFGVMSACGKGWSPYWNAAVHGQSAIREVEHLQLNGSSLKYAGFIADFDPKQFVTNRKSLKVMSREIQLAVAAGKLALEDAKLLDTAYDQSRIGVVLGTGVINNDLDEIERVSRARLTVRPFSMAQFGQDGVRSPLPCGFLNIFPICRPVTFPSRIICVAPATPLQPPRRRVPRRSGKPTGD